MSTFKEIRGQLIRKYTTNPTDPLEGQMWYNNTTGTLKGMLVTEAWSSGAPLSTGRESMGRGGTQTDALVFGGDGDGPLAVNWTNVTEEYNGSGWATGGNLPVSRNSLGGSSAGSTTAAFAAGGGDASYGKSDTYEYDGSTWTVGGSLATARSFTPGVGAGTLTAGLVFGGDTYPPASRYSVLTEEYNGASWTAGGALGSGGYSGAGTGTQTAALWLGGGANAPTTYVSHYNGTSWTAQTDSPFVHGSGSAGGLQTSAIYSGGVPFPGVGTKSYSYDGATWTAAPDLATGRYNHGSAAGGNTAGVVMGGRGPLSPNFYTFTEEFNRSANVITAGAWAAGGALTNARRSPAPGIGPATAAMAVGGIHVTTALAYNEQYDGTSWTEGAGALNTARSNMGGSTAGSQTAALVFGGSTTGTGPGITNTTESYDGSTWTTTPNSMNTGRNSLGGAGTSTAALGFGGVVHPLDQRGDTEEWDGTSWTEGPDMIQGRISMGTCGTQTAALGCSGYVDNAPSPTAGNKDLTEEYNGASWTAGGANLLVNAGLGAAGTTTDALSFGGVGDTNVTTGYDGTAWSTRPSLGTGRDYVGMAGTAASALCIAGNAPGDAGTTTVEEFTGETSAANIKTITTS